MAGGRRRGPRHTLAVFVQALEGQRLVVELRYDTVVRGRLLSADDQLNLQLAEASVQPLQGPRREGLEYVYVKGRHVRFIHLPANLQPGQAIEQHRRRVAAAMRQHAQAQAQAAQQPAGRLQKGTQLEFGDGGAGGSSGAAGMDTS